MKRSPTCSEPGTQRPLLSVHRDRPSRHQRRPRRPTAARPSPSPKVNEYRRCWVIGRDRHPADDPLYPRATTRSRSGACSCIVLGIPMLFPLPAGRGSRRRGNIGRMAGYRPAVAGVTGSRPDLPRPRPASRRWCAGCSGPMRWARPLEIAGALAARLRRLIYRRGSTAAGPGPARALRSGRAIAFLVWLYRAEANARALGAQDMMVLARAGPSAGSSSRSPTCSCPSCGPRHCGRRARPARLAGPERAAPFVALWWACWLGSDHHRHHRLPVAQSHGAIMTRSRWSADFLDLVSANLHHPSAALLGAAIVGRIQAAAGGPPPPRRPFRLIRPAAAPASRLAGDLGVADRAGIERARPR